MIQISLEKYDDEKNIGFITKQGKNIWGTLSIMQFEDNMDYFGIKVEHEEINGRKGYVFSNSIDTELFYSETRRFIEEHNLENIECI